MKSETTRGSRKDDTHQPKPFLTVRIQDDVQSLQVEDPGPRPQLGDENIEDVRVKFGVNLLVHCLREGKRSVSYFDYESAQIQERGEQGLTVHKQLDARLDRVDFWPAEGDRTLLALPLLRDRGCWCGYGDIQVEVHV